MPKTLTRDPAGNLIHAGSYFRTWAVDFATATEIPAWLTVSQNLTGAAAITNGRLVLTASELNAWVAIATPTVSLADVASVRFTARGLTYSAGVNGQLIQAVSTWDSVLNNGAIGAQLHKTDTSLGTFLRGTVGDWPVTAAMQVDDIHRKATAVVNRTLLVLPGTRDAYALEDGTEVMRARTMATMNRTSPASGVLGVRSKAGATVEVTCTGLEMVVGYK